MIRRKPEGYKELLAYQKAARLQTMTFALTARFPKTKTLIALADQMDRSARSGTKNIIEGWMRNTTREYFTFLGYSIGSIEELKDDAADIAKGLYRYLMTIPALWKGSNGNEKMGEMGIKGEPLDPIHPIIPFKPLTPIKPFTPSAAAPATPLSPFTTVKPFQPLTEFQLTSLRFYPLDPNLPPIVQIYLQAKEVLMLLHKLQGSLDVKMDKDLTKPSSDRARGRIQQFEKGNRDIKKMIEASGLVQLEDGQWIKREEREKREEGNSKGRKGEKVTPSAP